MARSPATPDIETLLEPLAGARPAWDRVLAALAPDRIPGVVHEWKFYGAKHGWQLEVSVGKKALIYVIPDVGQLRVGLAFKGAALERLVASDLPKALIAEVVEAREYGEGRPARVVVRGLEDAAIVLGLIAAKLEPAR